MPDKDLLNATIYDENEAFITGETEQPCNIEEIKYNLLAEYGKEFTSIWSRAWRVVGIYMVALLMAWFGSTLILGWYTEKQYVALFCFILPTFGSILMPMGYVISYIRGRKRDVEKSVEILLQNSKFAIGRVTNVVTNHEGTTIHYNFSAENSDRARFRSYLIRESEKNYKPKKQITVWFNDDDTVISTLL